MPEPQPAKSSTAETWAPELGDMVWLNYPDCPDPEGKVVGFVPGPEKRDGQPIIERQEDRPSRSMFGNPQAKGDRVVISPRFLLPFAYGGPEWRKADAEGRVRG